MTCNPAHVCQAAQHATAHTAPDWAIMLMVPALIIGVVGLFWVGAILSTKERS